MLTAMITGACGFIGKNLINELISKGYKVIAVDRPDAEFLDTPNVTFIGCDITNKADLEAKITAKCDVLYHLAWIGVNPEARSDINVQKTNIDASINVIELAKKLNVPKVVFIGSTLEYCFNGSPISKSSRPTPANAYGSVKVAVRYICSQLCATYGIDFKYAVITSIYGPNRNDNSVINYCIRSFLNGTTPELSACTQLWDFIHISDAVAALALIGETECKETFYAIGSGENKELKYYVEAIKNIIDPDAEVNYGAPSFNTNSLCSAIDLTDLENATGFKPKYLFSEGITEVIKSFNS